MANSVDPDETPHDATSHRGLRCLPKGISVRNNLNIEINILDIPNFGNKLIQFRRMGESTSLGINGLNIKRTCISNNKKTNK